MGVKSFAYTAYTTAGTMAPESGALTTVTVRGTTTAYTTYTDSGLTTPAANPHRANALGAVGPLYFDDTDDVTFTVKTADGATKLITVDYRDGAFQITYLGAGQLAQTEPMHTGDGTTKAFLLTGFSANSVFDVIVHEGGIYQAAGRGLYGVSSDGTDTTVTFTTAPRNGTAIDIRSLVVTGLPGGVSNDEVTGTDMTVARSLATIVRELGSVAGYGVNGLANGTEELQLAFDTLDSVYIGPGTYNADEITIDRKVDVTCHPEAIFVQRVPGAGLNQMITFAAGSEGSRWKGGKFNGNWSTLRSTWTYSGVFGGWHGMVIDAEDVRFSDAEFYNWIDGGLVVVGDGSKVRDIVYRDSAYGPLFGWSIASPKASGMTGKNLDVNGIAIKDIDNDGIATFCHCGDAYGVSGTIRGIKMIRAAGDASSLSAYVSGFTGVNCDNLLLDDIQWIDANTDVLKHLGISLQNSRNFILSNSNIEGLAGVGFEMLGCMDGTIADSVFDGAYLETTAQTLADGHYGISHAISSYYPDVGARRSLAGNRNMVYAGNLIRRWFDGTDERSGSALWSGNAFEGNRRYGRVLKAVANTAQFPAAPTVAVRQIDTTGNTYRCNGRADIVLFNGNDEIKIHGETFRNSGQDTTASAVQRSAIQDNTNNSNIHILDNLFVDDQDFDDTLGCSFNPGATDANNRKTVTLLDPDRYSAGQYVTLENAVTGPADATGIIIDIDLDEAIIEFASSLTFISSGNTTALSGTWSSSGTALTGTSGAANTEVTGPLWATDGSQWFQIAKVSGANAMTAVTAPSPALSGATISVLSVDVEGIPSQQHAIQLYSTTTSPTLKGNACIGQVISPFLLSDPSTLTTGSEYERNTGASFVSLTTDPQTLISTIPAGHVVTGWSYEIGTAITTATSLTLEVCNSGGTVLETLYTTTTLTAGAKARGSAVGQATNANGNIVRINFDAAPGAGTIKLRINLRVDAATSY